MRRTPRFKEMLGRGKKGNDREEGEAGRGEEEWGWAGGSKLVRTREAAVLLGTNPARFGVPGPDLLLLPGLVLKEARDVEGSEDVGGRTCKEDRGSLLIVKDVYIDQKECCVRSSYLAKQCPCRQCIRQHYFIEWYYLYEMQGLIWRDVRKTEIRKIMLTKSNVNTEQDKKKQTCTKECTTHRRQRQRTRRQRTREACGLQQREREREMSIFHPINSER